MQRMQGRRTRPSRSEFEAEGQEMLDGLPIPAAEIACGAGEPARIRRANESFRTLVGHDERLRGSLVADVPLLEVGPVGDALRDLWAGDTPFHQFDTFDQAALGGRAFVVRLARLSGTAEFPDRCLLSLLDRIEEIGPERSFRPDQARDPLTGLPNRHCFEERVGEVLGHPNFEARSHALLSIRLAIANEQPNSNEVMIAAARRLLSALRAGDLLARTGPASFAILTRLEPGQPDAAELAQRLGDTLATPFRLSDCELRIESAIELAPLGAVA